MKKIVDVGSGFIYLVELAREFEMGGTIGKNL